MKNEGINIPKHDYYSQIVIESLMGGFTPAWGVRILKAQIHSTELFRRRMWTIQPVEIMLFVSTGMILFIYGCVIWFQNCYKFINENEKLSVLSKIIRFLIINAWWSLSRCQHRSGAVQGSFCMSKPRSVTSWTPRIHRRVSISPNERKDPPPQTNDFAVFNICETPCWQNEVLEWVVLSSWGRGRTELNAEMCQE